MDQLTQGAPSPQPGPQQIPPAVTPPVSVPPAATSVQPASTQPVDVAPASPSKLKNPKLWIGAGVLLLVVVVGAAIFLGKPPLFTGRERKFQSPAERCASYATERICHNRSNITICAWVENTCQERAVAVVSPEPPPPPPPPPLPITDPQARARAAKDAAKTARDTAATAATAAGVAAGEADTDVARTAETEARMAAGAANIAYNEITILLQSFNNRTTAEAAEALAVEAETRRGTAENARDQAVAAQGRAEAERDRVVAEREPPAEPPPPPPEDLETTRRVALENAGPLVVAADAAATEAKRQVDKEYIEEANIEAAKSAANDAQAAAAAARDAAKTIKDAQTLEGIQAAFANVQTSHDTALEKRDVVTALVRAAEDAARYARERTQAAEAAQAREFERRCNQEKANYDSDTKLCTLADGTKVSNIAELEAALGKMQEESARLAFQEFCKGKNLEWKDNQCIFNGNPYNNRQALETALAAAGDEDQKKKDCEDKNKDKDPKAPEWRWDKDKKECVGGKVAIAEVPKCTAEKPVFFGNECHEQDELCATLGAKLTDELKAKKVDPQDIEHAVTEMNSLSECGFTAAQFLAPLEEEKAKNECAAKDQDVWEWNASEKQCKNKQEGRMRELESLVASLQGQLANAQSSNNDAQINALAEQIATLNSQINELRGAAGEPIVITVVAPPAPAPAAPPPAAPPSGGGGEIVAVATPEVKKEEKKDSKKKKDKKAASGTASVETAAASAPAVSDSGAAAGVIAVQPAATGTAAAGSAGSAPATSAAASTRVTHGAFIQGRTGPGVLIYPLAVIGANGVWYVLRKRRKK